MITPIKYKKESCFNEYDSVIPYYSVGVIKIKTIFFTSDDFKKKCIKNHRMMIIE